MLTEVKNQIKISVLSIKYAFVRELLNKVSFFSNIIFMILNNASMIVQWVILYTLKDSFGGYTFKQVLLLWGFASCTYGVSHFFFKNAYKLSSEINLGKVDVYLVQPKNVLLSMITTDVEPSALGDILYGYIMLFIYGINLKVFLLFTFLSLAGGLIITAVACIFGSLSFWFGNAEAVADTGNSLMINFATYPDGIFKGVVKALLFTLIPVGITTYIPVRIVTSFNIKLFLIVCLFTIFIIFFAFFIFNKGLKRYSSTNLMNVRV